VKEKPSQVLDRNWVTSSHYFSWCSSYWSGKWIIFLPLAELDEAYQKVWEAFHNDKFGPMIKCSTGVKNDRQVDCKEAMIVIYTNDFNDAVDLRRVLKDIRELGFSSKIFYKRDHETFKGIYGPDSFYAWSDKDHEITYNLSLKDK
jgi:hypothetical protein